MSLLSFQRKDIPKLSTAVFKASFQKFSFWPWKGEVSLRTSKIIIILYECTNFESKWALTFKVILRFPIPTISRISIKISCRVTHLHFYITVPNQNKYFWHWNLQLARWASCHRIT